LWLGQEIMPLVWKTHPDSTLWIVGNVPPDSVKALAGERIKVTGFVPELEPYFEHARVSVNPLRYGAGVKGKIVTSLQAGIPVVTTSCGNEGIQLLDGEEALIADTSTGIADAVNRLLDDESLCHTLIRSGANVVRTRFSASRARQILQNVLGDGVCSVCGSRPRQEKQARDDWRKGIYCLNCGADNRVGAVAQAMITPWRRQRVNTVHEALFYLQDLHIHELDNSEALSSELSRLRGYSHADGMREKSLRPGSLDLLLAADDSRLAPSRAHELLKTGGRYILTVMDDPTMEAGELRQTGLHVSSHKVAMPAYDQKELWVLEARKL